MQDRRRSTGSQTSLREANRARLVDAVKRYGGLTQVELAGATGLAPATVSNIVKELSASGVLRTTPATHSGRRALRVTLAHGRGLVAGVHVTERHLRVVLADLATTAVAEHHMPLAQDHRADQGLDTIALLVVDMLETVDSTLDELLGVGVGIAAPVDARTGRIASAGILRGWRGSDIGGALAARLGRPVHLDNAANLAAVAEWRRGAGRGRSDLVVLDVGEGIGAGIVTGGQLLRGHRGAAGEFGHTVVEPGGPVCRCGARGCLEAVAAAPAVLERLGDPRLTKLGDVLSRAVGGDQTAIRALADAGRTIGRAAAGLCNVLDPERVVLAGELARAGELLAGPMRHALEDGLLIDPDGVPDLVPGQLGDSAAVQGAVLLAVEHARTPPNGHDTVTNLSIARPLAFTT